MSKKVNLKFSGVPPTVIEPLGNFIRKLLYTVKERYAVVGLSILYTDKYTGDVTRVLPYDVIPNTTVTPSDIGILLTSKNYTWQSDVFKSLEANKESNSGDDEVTVLSTVLRNTNKITMQSLSELILAEDSELVSFNENVTLTLEFYVMKITSDFDMDSSQQLLDIFFEDKKESIMALPAALNTDRVYLNYEDKSQGVLNVTVVCDDVSEKYILINLKQILPAIIENCEYSCLN